MVGDDGVPGRHLPRDRARREHDRRPRDGARAPAPGPRGLAPAARSARPRPLRSAAGIPAARGRAAPPGRRARPRAGAGGRGRHTGRAEVRRDPALRAEAGAPPAVRRDPAFRPKTEAWPVGVAGRPAARRRRLTRAAGAARPMFRRRKAMTAMPNPSGDRADLTLDQPPIRVTTWDHFRLSAVVDAFRLRGWEPVVDFLGDELDRAELVEPAAIPPDVVTMHSCVRFIDHDTGEARTVTLVYPGEEDSRQGKISVVTPVGSALIGLRAGDTMPWRTPDGRTKRLSVLEVRHQPEAHGLDGASGRSDRESTPWGAGTAAAG